MEMMPLLLKGVLKARGTVFYNDGRRRIDIKRPISSIFSNLEDKNTKIAYSMEFYLSKEKFMQRIGEIAGKEGLPVLLWFYK